MEFNTFTFDPKSSKGYAYWQETALADVTLLLFSVVEYAKSKQHQIHSSWHPGNFSGLLRQLKLALTVQMRLSTHLFVGWSIGLSTKMLRKY